MNTRHIEPNPSSTADLAGPTDALPPALDEPGRGAPDRDDTEAAYARQNPKRAYYLSMEFLIGRSLANNVSNLLFTQEAYHGGESREQTAMCQLARCQVRGQG